MTHSKMRLIVASNNSNKLREFREILGERFDIVSMHEAGIDADIEENGTTFEENALIKANYVMNACHCAAIADDSGLEVDALGGAPGVYSARYCGRADLGAGPGNGQGSAGRHQEAGGDGHDDDSCHARNGLCPRGVRPHLLPR